MPYTYAENIKSVIIASMSQFQSGDDGSNFGIGFSGWDAALDYSRVHNLDYFGSVFLATGDDETPMAFNYGMWRWLYYIRMHVKFEIDSPVTVDEKVMNLADEFMDALLDNDNVHTIAPSGFVKITSANYLGNAENINDVTYITIEFVVVIKEQIQR